MPSSWTGMSKWRLEAFLADLKHIRIIRKPRELKTRTCFNKLQETPTCQSITETWRKRFVKVLSIQLTHRSQKDCMFARNIKCQEWVTVIFRLWLRSIIKDCRRKQIKEAMKSLNLNKPENSRRMSVKSPKSLIRSTHSKWRIRKTKKINCTSLYLTTFDRQNFLKQ